MRERGRSAAKYEEIACYHEQHCVALRLLRPPKFERMVTIFLAFHFVGCIARAQMNTLTGVKRCTAPHHWPLYFSIERLGPTRKRLERVREEDLVDL